MAGHSKFKNIMYRKGAQDAKRAKMFTKIGRELLVAARNGADPSFNSALRSAITMAKAANMPKDRIDRAIKRGAGGDDDTIYDEISYEGYGPGGVALIVDALTDNRNRTVAELRHIFSKNGGNLGENGCVAWIFNKKSLIVVEKDKVDEEQVMELALGAGAEDLKDEGVVWEICSPQEAHADVLEALEAAGIPTVTAEVSRIPSNTVKVAGKQAGSVIRMIDKLEEQDDVQDVFANFDIDDAELEALSA